MDILGFYLNKDTIMEGVIILLVGWSFKKITSLLKVTWGKTALLIANHLPVVFSGLVALVQKLFTAIFHPLAKFIYLVVISLILLMTLKSPYNQILAFLTILISWSLYSEASRRKSSRDPLLLDTFPNFNSWQKVDGDPQIDTTFGNPAPSLFLPIVTGNPNNSIAKVKNMFFTNGVIEAEVYLEPNSLVNLIFRADFINKKYYMARFDSRPGSYDSFLRSDGHGWGFIATSNNTTSPDQWHKMRVVVSGDTFQLHNEGGLIVSVNDATYSKGEVGFFNEVANAHVDNFSIKT